MKNFNYKKILVFLLFLMCIAITGFTGEPPQKIIFHNIMDGEYHFNPLKKSVSSKKDINLYQYPDLNSSIIAILPANSLAKISALQLHTYPYRNKIAANNQTFYYLYYSGEGYYMIWLNDKIQEVYMGTNQIDTKCDLWICVKSPTSQLEGWTKFQTREDWYTVIGDGIYL